MWFPGPSTTGPPPLCCRPQIQPRPPLSRAADAPRGARQSAPERSPPPARPASAPQARAWGEWPVTVDCGEGPVPPAREPRLGDDVRARVPHPGTRAHCSTAPKYRKPVLAHHRHGWTPMTSDSGWGEGELGSGAHAQAAERPARCSPPGWGPSPAPSAAPDGVQEFGPPGSTQAGLAERSVPPWPVCVRVPVCGGGADAWHVAGVRRRSFPSSPGAKACSCPLEPLQKGR